MLWAQKIFHALSSEDFSMLWAQTFSCKLRLIDRRVFGEHFSGVENPETRWSLHDEMVSLCLWCVCVCDNNIYIWWFHCVCVCVSLCVCVWRGWRLGRPASDLITSFFLYQAATLLLFFSILSPTSRQDSGEFSQRQLNYAITPQSRWFWAWHFLASRFTIITAVKYSQADLTVI